ncbi:hypothetical protein [Alkalicoccus halolimnae]|uniref:PspA/IM30 family protein n=1 Tax=Alkalicoccus halolimnae TaxID=1667239 RepID=A0A5C7F587_9BACI|nr:hypothetical protein [Alkalicoccus halolimnae]TXF85821.1 hypothetical protein FTX54_07010 [Alkalicoccus halolimnae]
MNNVWERMKEIMKQDWEKLAGDRSLQKAAADNFSAKHTKTEKLEKKLQAQKQLLAAYEKERDEVDVTIAAKRRQLHLAREENEDVLAAYAEKEIAAYELRRDRLASVINEAEEQQRELEEAFQELKHQLRDMELDQLEARRKEDAAQLRREMSVMKAKPSEEKAVPEEADESKMNDMERQLMLLEKRHTPKDNPADFLNK